MILRDAMRKGNNVYRKQGLALCFKVLQGLLMI